VPAAGAGAFASEPGVAPFVPGAAATGSAAPFGAGGAGVAPGSGAGTGTEGAAGTAAIGSGAVAACGSDAPPRAGGRGAVGSPGRDGTVGVAPAPASVGAGGVGVLLFDRPRSTTKPAAARESAPTAASAITTPPRRGFGFAGDTTAGVGDALGGAAGGA